MNITKISKEALADYLERIFQNETVIRVVSSSPATRLGRGNFERIAHILNSYARATGDLSDTSIERIALSYEQYYDTYKESTNSLTAPRELVKLKPIQKFFRDHVMDLIIGNHVQKLSIQFPLKINDMLMILAHINAQCNSNQFLTHTFPGALIGQIDAEGLDISRELFLKEYSVLAKIAGDSPFKKGVLCVCELSEATFGYGTIGPERFTMIANDPSCKREPYESNMEFYKRNLVAVLDRKGDQLTPEERALCLHAGDSIADFYYTNNQVGVAIIRAKDGKVDMTVDNKKSYLLGPLQAMKFSISAFLKADSEIAELYERAVASVKGNDYSAIDEFFAQCQQKYPENKIVNNFLRDSMCAAMTQLSLSNFMQSYADGYPLPDGRLNRGAFSLAILPNPIDLVVNYHMRNDEKAR